MRKLILILGIALLSWQTQASGLGNGPLVPMSSPTHSSPFATHPVVNGAAYSASFDATAPTTSASATILSPSSLLGGGKRGITPATSAYGGGASFYSTSSFISARGEAAEGGAATGSTASISGPKRVGWDTPPADPFLDPVGDVPFWAMLLLALAYGAYVFARKRKLS